MKYTFLKQIDVNTPKGEVITINSIKNVSKFITKNNYSGGHYLTGRRLDLLLACINLIIIDIDEKQPNNKSIEDIKKQLQNYNHIIAPTRSHQRLKNRRINDRYRILLFIDQPITDHIQYKRVVSNLSNELNITPDRKCFNVSHFYFKSSFIYSMKDDGDYLKISNYDIGNIEEPEIKDFQYFMSELDIPAKLQTWIESQQSSTIKKKKKRFIRILMAQHNLVRKDEAYNKDIGVGVNIIPQEFLANFLSVDQKTFRKWIKELISMGQLEIVCEKYGKGYKGKDYRALDELKQSVINSFYKIKELKDDVELPNDIKDGEWEDTLIRAVWAFHKDASSKRFTDWVKSLPSFYKKADRIHKIERAWINMKKRKAYLEYTKCLLDT